MNKKKRIFIFIRCLIPKPLINYGKDGVLLRRSHNRKAFSFLEITMGFSIFLMLLSCFYPSLHLFYKSYVKVRKLSLIEREQQDLERRSEEHTSELQSRQYLVCRLLLEKKKKN